MKKTVVKVSIQGDKCKRGILKAIAKLDGIDEMSIDGEKGTVTVIGEVDPIMIVEKLRKSKKMKSAEIVSVGPPPKKQPSGDDRDSSTTIRYTSNYPPFTSYFPPLLASQPFDRW